MYDVERLGGLLAWVESPESLGVFDYRYYARRTPCGTTLCMGGKLAVDDGVELVWEVPLRGGLVYATVCTVDGEALSIHSYAEAVCGLTYREADALFAAETGSADDDEKCARDFLNLLVVRAENGMPNMGDEEVGDWFEEWKLANCTE